MASMTNQQFLDLQNAWEQYHSALYFEINDPERPPEQLGRVSRLLRPADLGKSARRVRTRMPRG